MVFQFRIVLQKLDRGPEVVRNNLGKIEVLPPNYNKLDFALRSVGYTFEAAVADIVDNSIDAEANDVAVRLILNEDNPLDLAVWDDGYGMSTETLKEAMRFGADVKSEIERLGKFGLGLKLAALGQAKELRVVSLRNGQLSGRAWLEDGIRQGFHSYLLDAKECEGILDGIMPDFEWHSSGTLVLWSHLYRVGQNHTEQHAQQLLNRLANHLSLAFHRFLSGQCKIRKRKTVRILLDIYDRQNQLAGLTRRVEPLNPFGYLHTGLDPFPTEMIVDEKFRDLVSIRAHIWPPNSKDANYKLPGGANSRQGFYFYRNDRLIQAGGWNGIRDTETHFSLARLEIDFVANFDIEVSLDVKKMNISLPQTLMNAILKSKTESGIDFKRYISLAEETYRTRAKRAAEMPIVPGEGLPSSLCLFLRSQFHHQGAGRHRSIAFKWAQLPHDLLFDVDNEHDAILLNVMYRQQLLHGLKASSADIPTFKCVLFLLLEEAFNQERLSSRLRSRFEFANRILIEAIKYERVD